MPVIPWKGSPPFGGKTLVLPGSAYKRKKAAAAEDSDAQPGTPYPKQLEDCRDDGPDQPD